MKIRHLALAAIGVGILALTFYVGVTKELCNRIDSFTPQEQQSMMLDAKACAKPWYAKL